MIKLAACSRQVFSFRIIFPLVTQNDENDTFEKEIRETTGKTAFVVNGFQ